MTRVSAVAVTSAGMPVVGTRCTGSDVGLFEPSDAAAVSVPDLPGTTGRVGAGRDRRCGATGATSTTVVRLRADGAGVAGLVETAVPGRSSVLGVRTPPA